MEKGDQKIHQQFTEYGLNAREWMRKCTLLLPEIERRQIWRKARCGSIFEYAAKLAGMSRTTVEDGLRIMKKAETFPALKIVVESRGVNRIRPVLGIITKDTEEFWAEKAKSMSRHTLETYVQNYRSESRTGPDVAPVKLTMELSLEMVEKLKTLKGAGTWEDLMGNLLEGQKGSTETAPEAVKTPSRHIPASIQRHVTERTGGLCAYPSCTRMATSLHHTQRWGLEKIHDPARLQAVCDGHERLAHLGLIENEEAAPQNWQIRSHPDSTHHKRFIDDMVALYRPT